MSIIGITASKDYLYLAMTTGPKAQLSVAQHHRIPVDLSDWPSLVATLSTHLSSYDAQDAIEHVAIGWGYYDGLRQLYYESFPDDH